MSREFARMMMREVHCPRCGADKGDCCTWQGEGPKQGEKTRIVHYSRGMAAHLMYVAGLLSAVLLDVDDWGAVLHMMFPAI